MSHLMPPVFRFQLEAELKLKLCAEQKTMVNSTIKRPFKVTNQTTSISHAHGSPLASKGISSLISTQGMIFSGMNLPYYPAFTLYSRSKRSICTYICIILGNHKHQGSQQPSITPQSWPLHPFRLNPLFPFVLATDNVYNKQISRLTTLTKESSLPPWKMELLLNNHPTDSGKPYISSLNPIFETRVQSLIGRDWNWLQRINIDALLAVLQCLAGYVESTVPRKILR
jgi:hypothetical protein